MVKIKLCKLCHKRPAAVPDRDTYCGRWRKEVCKECHAARLVRDLGAILAHAAAKAKEAR
jgi:hypothetical protein